MARAKRELNPGARSITGSYIRLWVDILDNPKIHELDVDLFSGWIKILVTVKKYRQDGKLPGGKILAFWTHQDGATVARWVRDLEARGFLQRDDDGQLWIHDWKHWQSPTNAERQQQYRARKKDLSRALSEDVDVDLDRDVDTNRNARCNAPVTRDNAPPPLPPPPSSSSTPKNEDADRVCNLAAKIGGDVSWSIWASRRLAMGDTPAILEAALSEGVNAGKVNQSYIGKIAARFAIEGIPQVKSNGNGHSGGEVPYKSGAKIYGIFPGP